MSDDNRTMPYPERDAEHTTLVIPGASDDRATDAGKRSRRRRWPWVLLTIAVVLALLVAAAELVARTMLPGVVRSIVVDQLDLPADQQLEAEAAGILLPQLIGGTLDSLHLSTDAVTLEGITGAVDVTATAVPLRGGDLGPTTGTVRIDEAQFTALVDRTDLPVDTVSFDAPDATVSGSIEVFGAAVPIALTVTPSADGGDLVLQPGSLSLGGVVLDAARMRDDLGSLGERLTQPQRICVADQFPAGVTLTALRIEGTSAVIDVALDGRIVTDAALQANGSCPNG
ncbi:LmeA family phospholipid-binding protein [Microbacterium sp.]|uniref:LmeA family phospholipid-binding protein n=1 Tax=Microbacterium sp. TaxID=51671 RepID=UPI0028118FA8|nr:LmeA family phospholipid-binding protein [Microbacterium sp.]